MLRLDRAARRARQTRSVLVSLSLAGRETCREYHDCRCRGIRPAGPRRARTLRAGSSWEHQRHPQPWPSAGATCARVARFAAESRASPAHMGRATRSASTSASLRRTRISGEPGPAASPCAEPRSGTSTDRRASDREQQQRCREPGPGERADAMQDRVQRARRPGVQSRSPRVFILRSFMVWQVGHAAAHRLDTSLGGRRG